MFTCEAQGMLMFIILSSLQEQYKNEERTGATLQPADTRITGGENNDSMFGNAFRRMSLAIRFLSAISLDSHSQGDRSESDVTMHDVNFSNESFESDKVSRQSVTGDTQAPFHSREKSPTTKPECTEIPTIHISQ